MWEIATGDRGQASRVEGRPHKRLRRGNEQVGTTNLAHITAYKIGIHTLQNKL